MFYLNFEIMQVFSFPPISNADARVLILGTMPGERSLILNQYYGNAGNIFWRLVFSIFNSPLSSNYEERKNLLLKNHIALWDVLKACERQGSSDNAIIQELPNDFKSFFSRHIKIELIVFNGHSAKKYFDKCSGFKPNVEYLTLPSTSPANTWKSFEEKMFEWDKIRLVN